MNRPPLDEDDIRIRANPRGTRPRTKQRPSHLDAHAGWVIAVDRGRYHCRLGDGPTSGDHERITVTAMKARELGKASVVVGDRVGLVGDVSGREGSLARVVRVEPRHNALRRSADDTDPVERVVVANAELLAIVTALADPEPRTRMVDRCLVAAYDAGLAPILVLTKADLADPAGFLAGYAGLELTTVVLGRGPGGAEGTLSGLESLYELVRNRVTVLIGHSGVGKSTLVNALVPSALRATGVVNDVTGRGRHTSTSAVALELPEGGWVIDTPGVRSFGLAHVEPSTFIQHFADLAGGTDECPRGCTHDEAECGLDAYVAAGLAGASGVLRLDSLRRLLRSRAGGTSESTLL